MKIGIDIRSLMDVNYSGVSNFTLKLIQELLAADKINEYKLYYNSGQDIAWRVPVFNYPNAEIVATHYPNKIFNYGLQKIGKYPLIDRWLGVDLFFLPHLNFIALSANCRKIITIHDLSFVRYPQFFSVRKNIWHYFLNLRTLLPRFDIIVAVSENTKRDLVELFNIPAEKIKVIYPGAGSLAPVRPIDIEATQKKYQLPADYFLYVGNLEPRKNVASIILAFDQFLAEHPEYNSYGLVLAGSKGWKFHDVFSAWKSAANKDKIHLLGYVSETEKNCLFLKASILIYPSFYEGFGFPVLEAMAAGVPVITSTNSSLPEVAQDAAILVNPFNLAEIKAAMLAILASSRLREQLRGKAELVKAKFKWKRAAQQYLKLFIS